jgi:6-phosphogluconolactonase
MTSTFRNDGFIAARTAAFAALVVLAACGGGGGSGPTYTIGGSISGLTGSGLVLRASPGNTVSVSKAGAFSFPTSLGAGASYDVTVASSPANPSQTCTVSNGSGTVSGAVDDITVVCVLSQFTVGGSVSGLRGTGLILRDNSGDDLPVSSTGAFVFKDSVASGGAYDVTIVSQPSGPTQNCVLLAGSAAGTVSSGNITDVSVVCESAGRFVYITDEQGNQIFGFTIDATSGALTPMPTSPFAAPTFPGSSVADPSSRFLYASSSGANGMIGTILAYSINQSTGALTAIQGFQFPLIDGGIVSPGALTIGPSGIFLYAAINEPETSSPPNGPNLAVAVFTINQTDGTLTQILGSPFAIGAYTIGYTPIVIGPSGQFLYIAYDNFGNSTSDVTAFSIDPTTGALSMVSGGAVLVDTPGPNVATIDPRGRFLYLGSQNCSGGGGTPEECGVVSTLAIDAISGALTVSGSTPQVADNVVFNPSGNLAFGVFVQAVTAYSADPTSGALTALAGGLNFNGVFDVAGPLVVDPSGNFAYLPQVGAGSILILKIDPSTGALSLLPGSPITVPGALLLTELIDVP